jgi:DNA repair protein SbcC/Rad50
MKPRRLVIEGLRSHRERTEIDFSDVSLFAIVGDTGSGKSSILEAIVYALYAAATWTKQPGELISDGKRTMTVELTFEVDGRVWIVRRSMSRGGYPAPIHLLTADDDPSVRFDSAAGVDQEIERLLGLSVDAFCSAVILPQGRFEKLLTSTMAERTRILKGIFRLERLDEARELCRTLVDSFRPRLDSIRLDRAALLPDPAGSAASARTRFETAQATISAMTALGDQLDQVERQMAAVQLELDSIAVEADALARARAAVDQAEGVRLAELVKTLDAALEPLMAAETTNLSADEAAASAIDEAKDAGLDPVSLARYRETAEQAQVKIPELTERQSRVALEQEAIREANAVMLREAEGLPGLATAAVEATGASKAARELANSARVRHDATTTAVAGVRALLGRRDDQVATLSAAETVAHAAALEARRCQELATNAVAQRDAEEASLAAANRLDAAATAAHNHAPGDPCPVCARPLPKTWSPPDASHLVAALATLETARSAHADAERRAREATTTSALADQGVAVATGQLASLTDELEGAIARLRGLIPDWTPERPDAALMLGLDKAAEEAEVSATALERAAETALLAEAQARTSLEERSTSVTRRSLDAERTLAEVEADLRQIAVGLTSLPVGMTLTPASSTEDFEAAMGRLETLDAVATARQVALDDIRRRRATIHEEKEVLARRRRDEVEVPLARYREREVRLSAAVERAASLLGSTEEGGDAADESTIDARAALVTTALSDRVVVLVAGLETYSKQASEALTRHGHTAREDVEAVLVTATEERAVAKSEHDQAAGQVKRAAELDRRVREGGAVVEALIELTRLLGDGSFISFVVEARQRALLGIASTILDEMSGGRYGFAEDFQIIDRSSGQPRSPKTLSGGETFQASLALALGLVELAGRSGGRLSSLFLDEGFGTLDANALDEALEELERRAASGRVIGVISHLRSVADRLEHVLRVDKERGRTTVRWMDGSERDAMAADGLAHVAGLTS